MFHTCYLQVYLFQEVELLHASYDDLTTFNRCMKVMLKDEQNLEKTVHSDVADKVKGMLKYLRNLRCTIKLLLGEEFECRIEETALITSFLESGPSRSDTIRRNNSVLTSLRTYLWELNLYLL
jgi:hypothetical protein